MAWTDLTFSVGQILTAAQMTNMDDNFDALAAGLSGAPPIEPPALDAAVGSWIEITQTVISGSPATVDFTTGIDDTYDLYMVVLQNVVPATDATDLYMRLSSASSWITTGSYFQAFAYPNASTGGAWSIAAGQAFIGIGISLGTGTGESYNGHIIFYNMRDTSSHKHMFLNSSVRNSSPNIVGRFGACSVNSQAALDGIRFYMASGNLSSGTITLYGMNT